MVAAMHIPLPELIAGIALSGIVAGAAWRKGALAASGFAAALIVGTLIYSLGNCLFWLVMILFFLSSSLLGRLSNQNKKAAAKDFAKGNRRDWLQVAANGSISLLMVAAYHLSGKAVFAVGCIAAFAAANADTWATEIGTLSRRKPVLIINFQPAPPGASGAVSWLGTGAALCGASFIALAAWLGLAFAEPELRHPFLAAAVAAGGFAGALVDSLLGATLQAMHRCQLCGRITERPIHHNQAACLVRGWKWFNNDAVNLVSTLAGALLAMALYVAIIQ